MLILESEHQLGSSANALERYDAKVSLPDAVFFYMEGTNEKTI